MSTDSVAKKEGRVVAFNTVMLYVMAIAKLIFPLITLPYLTRVLSKESYGLVSYVKSCMTYMQLIIDFGFILSSVKDIVKLNGDKKEIGYVVGRTYLAKGMLCVVAGIVLGVMCICVPILRANVLFTFLSFGAIATTVFLADFLFRGIEKMQIITVIYLVMKTISTVLTFLLVKGDGSLLWVPVLDIIGNLAAVLLTAIIIVKMKIPVCVDSFKKTLAMIKDSFVYFLSSVATTAFSALNTLLIGIYIKDLAQVAQWSLCISIISAIQGLYAPICNGIYPHMIKRKQLSFVHKVLAIFMPVVAAGCVLCFFLAKFALGVMGGEEYVSSYPLFRLLIPILFFSFPAQLYGWPTLGAVGLVAKTTLSTVISAICQVVGLLLLGITGNFTLTSLALLRGCTELILLLVRMFFTYKNRDKFSLTQLQETPTLEEATSEAEEQGV